VGAFMSELTITHPSGNDTHGCWRLWRLAEPLIYEVGGRGSGRVILVTKGFVTTVHPFHNFCGRSYQFGQTGAGRASFMTTCAP